MKKRFPLVFSGARVALLLIGLLAMACTSRQAVISGNGALPRSSVANKGASKLELGQVLLTGLVQKISVDEIILSGVSLRIDENTAISANLKVGSSAQALAIRLPDQTRYAFQIVAVTESPAAAIASEPNNESGFEFNGILEVMDGNLWQVSGYQVKVNEKTQLDPVITTGNIVRVEGSILDGTMVASEIGYARFEMDDEKQVGDHPDQIDTGNGSNPGDIGDGKGGDQGNGGNGGGGNGDGDPDGEEEQ